MEDIPFYKYSYIYFYFLKQNKVICIAENELMSHF